MVWIQYRSQWSSGNMPDCGVRGPRSESYCRQKFHLSQQPLQYTALGMGSTPLLQCLAQLSLLPLWDGKMSISLQAK